jgi:ZIP family zinc transporter
MMQLLGKEDAISTRRYVVETRTGDHHAMDLVLEPIALSLVAGMATGLGGIIVISLRRLSDRIVGFSLGFASGVMLLVSFNNLFLEAARLLTHAGLIVMFSLGAITIVALDLVIPHIEFTARRAEGANTRIFRSGILIAAGITIHNFPEGLIVTAGYSFAPKLGIIIAVAIMLHNIPEGVATAVPFAAAGMKRSKIAILTFLSGLPEPVAASIGVILFSLLGKSLVGSSLAFAAGVMTYITADELIPVAHEYGHKHTVSVALLIGIMFALLVDVIIS